MSEGTTKTGLGTLEAADEDTTTLYFSERSETLFPSGSTANNFVTVQAATGRIDITTAIDAETIGDEDVTVQVRIPATTRHFCFSG